jgi:hypothetical protein
MIFAQTTKELQMQLDDAQKEYNAVKTCAIIGCITGSLSLICLFISATTNNNEPIKNQLVDIESAIIWINDYKKTDPLIQTDFLIKKAATEFKVDEILLTKYYIITQK